MPRSGLHVFSPFSRSGLLLFSVFAVVLTAAGVSVMYGGDPAPRVAPGEPGAFGYAPGELVADFGWRAVDGRRGRLSDLLDGNKALVLAVRTVECPVAQKYGHRLARLEETWAARGVAFAWLNPSPQDTGEEIAGEVETFGFDGPYIADPDGRIAAALQVGVSTEVFVIDETGTLRYRGAVDDQFGISFAKPEPRERYLEDALEAVLAGRDVETPRTEASGCYLEPVATAGVPQREITWHSRVSRIVQQNCVGCHRDGGVAPFSLESYEQAYGFRQMIRFMVSEGRMPPWFADPAYGEWSNERRLPERDKRDLLAWIDAGAPEGDAALEPLPRALADGWQLPAEPDVVIEIPEPVDVPAEGVLDYQYVYVKTDFDRDLWVQALEPQPTAKQQTHHIIAYLEAPGDEARGPFFGGWAPGMPAAVYPQGTAKRLPKGAWLMFELHYTPNGRPATDRSRIGLVLADEPAREVRTSWVATTDFEIPPHAPDHEVVAERTFRSGGEMIMLLPHMHLRGKAFRLELIRDDGSEEILLDVPRYDFNWQLWYRFAEPLRVEPGWVLRGRARYDNSAANPANPDPTVAVGYGEQSFEEMMFGFFDWVPDPAKERQASGSGGR